MKQRWLIGLGLWVSVVVLGFRLLTIYQDTPGQAAEPLGAWPADSALRPRAGQATLILFAHPHCPCSRASLESLEWLLSRTSGQLGGILVLVRPPHAPVGWEEGELGRRGRAHSGLRVVTDEDGTEARRFDATTSGQALLYDAAGRLRFAGGLTDGRGHGGDNPGRSAVLSWLAGTPAATSAPVFGCPLFDASPPD